MATVTGMRRRASRGRFATRALFVGPGLDDLLAAVIAARADVMAAVRLAGHRLERERRRRETIVRAMHAALRRGLLVLLDCHGGSPDVNAQSFAMRLVRGSRAVSKPCSAAAHFVR